MSETVSAKPSFRRVLANRPFALLWIGQLVSQSGDYIFDVVALWLVLQLTGDVFKVGLTTAIIFLPPVLVAPIAGVYIDRLNRRDILLASNVFQAIIVAGIAGLYSVGSLTFPVLLILLFLLNAGAQFVRPTVSAVIPQLASKEDLSAANGLFSISSSLNQIAGFGIGGILILLLGLAVPIYYDSLTFLFAAVSVWKIARSTLEAPDAQNLGLPQTGNGQVGFREKFLEGLRYIRTSRFLLELVALAIVLNFFAGGIQTLIAPYSKITINGNASTYGTLLAALSLGTVVGSVVVGKIDTRKYVGKVLFAAVIGLGGSTALIGLTTNAFVAIGLMFAVGLFLAFANLPLQTMIQAKVPGNLLGRVFTSLVAIVTVATPVAAIATGSLAGSLMIGPTLLLYGSSMIVVTAIAFFAFREVRSANY